MTKNNKQHSEDDCCEIETMQRPACRIYCNILHYVRAAVLQHSIWSYSNVNKSTTRHDFVPPYKQHYNNLVHTVSWAGLAHGTQNAYVTQYGDSNCMQ